MEKDIEIAIKKINSMLNFVYNKVEDKEVKSLLKDSKLNINSIKNIMDTKLIAYKPINILIADDVKLNTCILEAMLDSVEYKIYIVHDGEEALDKMKELKDEDKSIDILLIDHRMPNMVGSMAVNIIRKDQLSHSHNNLKVVSITNEPNAIIEHQHLYDKHISKPFLKNEIIEIIKKLTKDIRKKH
jgi:CheY-like chemotaxis protein